MRPVAVNVRSRLLLIRLQLDPVMCAYGTRMERISAGPWLTQDGRGEG